MTTDVVILGGGLAGVACARTLGEEGVSVTLVDRNDYNQFQPLLYQVATSQLPAEDIARPLRAIVADLPTVDVVVADVVSVRLSDRTLVLGDGRTLSGDHLVVAAGARPNFFGVPGADEYSFPLYSVADAERLRVHAQDLFEHPDEEGALGDYCTPPGAIGRGPDGVLYYCSRLQYTDAYMWSLSPGTIPNPTVTFPQTTTRPYPTEDESFIQTCMGKTGKTRAECVADIQQGIDDGQIRVP